tara:strand:+ start:1726 stop:8508 length:6783 start_codon:yes stop_codon:yes gene_type:complete
MPIQIPVTQTGLEASIEAAAKRAGKSLKVNMGPGAKSIEGLSQPLGRITGKADQFTKSMEAANARVLAFGASVGVLSAVTRGFQDLVKTTVEVEKSLASINSILGTTTQELDRFKKTIFDVARNTEQSFDTVAQAALELSRQGLKAEEVTKRLNDSLVLSRLSGLGAAEAVAGLTSAINSFNSTGITSAEVLNKLSAAAVSAAVSERDLIEGIKRSGSVAIQAGVSFNELVGVITAVQERTARGGAVIGNSFKTIFTRIQSLDKLQTMQNLGVEVTDASGQVLSATKLIQNLGKTLETLPDAKRLQIAENLVGKFQIAPFLAILEDYNRETSTAIKVTEIAANATTEAYSRNVALNQTLSAAINEATVNLKELANTLGEIGVTDSLQNILGFFNSLVGNIKSLLEGEGLGSDFAKGIVKGIGAVLSGPGLAIFGAIIAKLTIDLAKFGVGSLKTFFGLNKAAKEQATLQGQIASTLLGNADIQKQIMNIENSTLSIEQKRKAQIKFFTTALNEQMAIMTRMQGIASKITPAVFAGTRGARGRGAGGYIPNFNAVMGYGSEQSDINKGVGGAPSSAKPVTIPNFNFGGGQRGTMVANTSEFIVPNFAGSGGSAIFNQNMVSSMGLPAGAKKIGAAGGYVPNFAKAKGGKKKVTSVDASNFFYLVPEIGKEKPIQQIKGAPKTVDGVKVRGGIVRGPVESAVKKGSDAKEASIEDMISSEIFKAASLYTKKLEPLGRIAQESEIQKGFDTTRGAKGALMGVIGAAFEVAIASSLDYRAAQREKGGDFDVRMGSNLETIKEFFGIPSGQNTGDFKVSTSQDNLKSFYQKVIKEKGAGRFDPSEKQMNAQIMATSEVRSKNPSWFDKKGNLKREFSSKAEPLILRRRDQLVGRRFQSASGYIPNFARGLEDAVARESAAGLPINQIRINQDPSLRNAGNPMGLAVTNTRDEPTGAIPNFAKGLTMQDIGTSSKPVEASLKSLNNVIRALNKEIKHGKMTNADANAELKKLTAQIKTNGQTRKKVNDAASERLSSDNEVKEGNRDLLGGIFALQAGMTMLGGATADATDGFARYTNIVSEGIAAGSTASFALEGLGGALEGAGGKVGKLGGFLKGLSVKVGILTAAYKIGSDVFDQVTGVTNAAADAMSQVSESAQKAAIRLDMLSPTGQKRVKDTMDRLTDGKFSGQNSAFAMRDDELKDLNAFQKFMLSSKGAAFGAREANFEGADLFGKGALRESLEAGMETVVASGGDMNQMLAAIDKIRKDGFISKDEVADTLTFFDQLIVKANKFTKAIQDAEGLGITEEDKEFLTKFDEDQLSAFLKGGKSRGSLIKKMTEGMSEEEIKEAGLGSQSLRVAETKLRERLFKDDGRERAVQDRDLHELRMALIKKEEDAKKKANDADTKAEEIKARITANQTNRIIRMAAERAKMNDTALDDAKEQLEMDILRTGLSAEEVINRKNGIKILEAERDSRNKTVDAVRSMVKLTSELTTKTDDVKALEELMAEASKDGVITQQEENSILEATNKVLEENTSEKVDQLNTLKDDIILSRENLGIAKDKLQTERDIALAKLEATRVESIADAGEAITRGRESRGALDPDIRERERIRARMRKRGLGLQTDFARESVELAQADDQIQLANVNARITRREGFEKELADTQAKLASALDKLAPGEGVARTGKANVRGMMTSVTDAAGLDQFLREQLRGEMGDIEGMGDVVRELQETMGSERLKREEGIQATIDEANARRENTALIKGLPDASFLLKNQAKALRDARAGDLLNAQLSTDPATRIKGSIRDSNFQKRFGLMQAGDVRGLRELDEAEQLAGTIVDSSVEFARNIGDAMVDAIAKGENLGDTLRRAASDFFLGLSKAFMNQAINNIMGNFGNPNQGGSGGGNGVIGGVLKSIFGFNSGGRVSGGSGNRDDVPALLTGGEFVMNKGAVKKYGPAFMMALNSGSVPTMNRGGMFTPGSYGQGAITGKSDLFNFATQGFTMGGYDKISGGSGFASIALEPLSARMTRYGIANSPQAQREKASQEQALGLYFQQLDKEKQLEEQRKQQKGALKGAIMSAIVSGALMGITGGMGKGKKAIGAGDPRGAGFTKPANFKLTDLFTGRRNQFGGSTDVYGNPGVLPLKNNNLMMAATGGSVPYAAGVDTVPAMLSGGEFVMNAAATQNIGRGNLAALNSGARGGNGEVVGKLDELIEVSGGSGETVINITVNSDGSETEDGGQGEEQKRTLAMRIKDTVKQVIEDEKRLGGSLRQAKA